MAHTYREEGAELVIRIISAQRRRQRKGEPMKVTKRQAKEIEALKRLRDEEIDLTDIRPLKNWNKAVIGKFLAPQRHG